MRNILKRRIFNLNSEFWNMIDLFWCLVHFIVSFYCFNSTMSIYCFQFCNFVFNHLCVFIYEHKTLSIDMAWYTIIQSGHSIAAGNRASCLSNCIFSLATLICFQKWKCQSEKWNMTLFCILVYLLYSKLLKLGIKIRV